MGGFISSIFNAFERREHTNGYIYGPSSNRPCSAQSSVPSPKVFRSPPSLSVSSPKIFSSPQSPSVSLQTVFRLPISNDRAEFLYRIFDWNPKWLKDEKYENVPPQYIDSENMTPTLLSYKSFLDYTITMTPLLIHEYWYTLKQDIEDKIRAKEITKSIEASVIQSEFQRVTIDDSSNREILRFTLTVYIKESGEDISKIFPSNGDLVTFKQPGSVDTEIFAFVEGMIRRKVRNDPEQRTQLTYTLVTKKLSTSQWPRSIKITTVTWLSAYLTLIDALLFIKRSPLSESILRPKMEAYRMSPMTTINAVPILTELRLNPKQYEVVARVTKTVEAGGSRICLIQGPPGTGKSSVIVNMVASMLSTKSTSKILLCASSNKAIDGVVIRLLKIQDILHAKGINLNMVRVGRQDKMDKEVVKISLPVLAHKEGSERLFEIEEGILKRSNVIACTLTSCYTSYRMKSVFGTNGLSIPVCIIDEAAQATELATLIPLMLGVKTLVLVGDPQQLPPTVLSPKAKDFKLDLSLFARAQKLFDDQPGNPILMLDTQYRMVDSIAQWPNRYFYKGALRNSASVTPLCYHNYKFLNHSWEQDVEDNRSNVGEAKLVTKLIEILMTQSNLKKSHAEINVGIITPYKKQRALIMKLMEPKLKRVSKEIKNKIKITDVNTVDSFQGSERDIIIMSCVRSAGIGFVSDPNRLCVSLTRAKHSLIICGNFNTFRRDPMWRDLLDDAQLRGDYVNIGRNEEPHIIKNHIILSNNSQNKNDPMLKDKTLRSNVRLRL